VWDWGTRCKHKHKHFVAHLRHIVEVDEDSADALAAVLGEAAAVLRGQVEGVEVLLVLLRGQVPGGGGWKV
jgi:hypothetical protein